MFSDYPIKTEFGDINTKRDCIFYSVRAGTCKDGMYKKCNPKSCTRLKAKEKSIVYEKKGGSIS